MQRPLNMEAIFPIKDAASAALMAVKADCLYRARVINEQEKQWVYTRARIFLDDAELKDGDISVSLARWKKDRQQLLKSNRKIGVRISSADSIADLSLIHI